MGLTTELASDLYNIQNLQTTDIDQLKILLIDFFAAIGLNLYKSMIRFALGEGISSPKR